MYGMTPIGVFFLRFSLLAPLTRDFVNSSIMSRSSDRTSYIMTLSTKGSSPASFFFCTAVSRSRIALWTR